MPTICVTGAAGFLGSYNVLEFLQLASPIESPNSLPNGKNTTRYGDYIYPARKINFRLRQFAD